MELKIILLIASLVCNIVAAVMSTILIMKIHKEDKEKEYKKPKKIGFC